MNRKLISVILLMVSCCAFPGLAEATGRSTVTFRDPADSRDRIYHFARGNSDHLVVNYWDGYAWYWADQGLPPGATAISHPSAITYKDTAGNQRIYVFAYSEIGTERNLVVNYWDGSQWHWANHGGDLEGSEEPTAVTYVDGYRRIYVFARRDDGHLAANYWNGLAWVWADRGLPTGSVGVFPLDAVTYADGDDQRIYVFAKAVGGAFLTGKLVVNHRDGNGWHWTNLSAAGGGEVLQASAITYFDESLGHQRIYVFSTGGPSTSLSLWVTYWDGSWHFQDLGVPPSQSAVRGPLSAISYVDENAVRRLMVFVSPYVLNYQDCCAKGLYLWYTDSFGAHWVDRGLPQPQWSGSISPQVIQLDAITYRSRSGYQWFHAFGLLDVSTADYYSVYLVRHYWGGAPVSLPSWAGQGPPP